MLTKPRLRCSSSATEPCDWANGWWQTDCECISAPQATQASAQCTIVPEMTGNDKRVSDCNSAVGVGQQARAADLIGQLLPTACLIVFTDQSVLEVMPVNYHASTKVRRSFLAPQPSLHYLLSNYSHYAPTDRWRYVGHHFPHAWSHAFSVTSASLCKLQRCWCVSLRHAVSSLYQGDTVIGHLHYVYSSFINHSTVVVPH